MVRPLPRVAVVGCGYWGRNLVRNYYELGALAAVVDLDQQLAREQAKLYGVAALSFGDALSGAEVDAVAIAAPAETHAALAVEALAFGKHVFVEKPLALHLEDGAKVVERAAEAGRVLMVGHLLQYHPGFLQLKRLIDGGEIGRLRYIYSNRLNFGKIRREENVFWSFAPHDISMILALVGERHERVQALGSCYLHKTVADVTTTHLMFPSGIHAHVFVSWLHPFKEQKLVVIGDSGMAVFDDGQPWSGKLIVYPHHIDWVNGLPRPAKAEGIPMELDEVEPLKVECEHFLDCITRGERPRTDGAEGLRVLEVLETAERSMQAGPLDSERKSTEKRSHFLDVFVHESSYIDEDCTIGPGTKIWHFSHILRGSRIGRNCIIGQNVMIGPDVVVGDGCKIQNNVSLYKGVTLEDDVFCGPSCVFTNVLNPRADIERKDEFQPTRVGQGATIGANATIVCGHEIGAYSLVAAGTVVTKDIPAHAVVAGVPARRIGWVSHAGERLPADLVCPRTGRHYRELACDRLVEIIEQPSPAEHG